MRKLFFVEGNIGAGKSTFLKLIADTLSVDILFEPHKKWQDVEDKGNLLERFYHDQSRWAYTFQSYAFITRIIAQQEKEKQTSSSIFVERSVYSDRYCFAQNCFEQGTMNALEWKLYREWFSWLVPLYSSLPAHFIYLRTDPLVCYERLQKRARHEELSVSFDYLALLHTKHEEWLMKRKRICPTIEKVPITVLECNKDFLLDKEQRNTLIKQIALLLDIHKQPPPQRRTLHNKAQNV